MGSVRRIRRLIALILTPPVAAALLAIAAVAQMPAGIVDAGNYRRQPLCAPM